MSKPARDGAVATEAGLAAGDAAANTLAGLLGRPEAVESSAPFAQPSGGQGLTSSRSARIFAASSGIRRRSIAERQPGPPTG